MGTTHYETLGIPETATEDEIKKAFKKIAFETHPDRNPGNAESEAKFKEANEAHQVLSDPEKRAQYDNRGNNQQQHPSAEDFFREAFVRMTNNGGGSFNNPFAEFFGRQNQQRMEIHGRVRITLRDVLFGKSAEEVEVHFGENKVENNQYNRVIHQFKVTINIPPGMRGGTVIHTKAKLPIGSVEQQINILVEQEQDPTFEMAPNGDIYSELRITYPQAIIGGTVEIDLIDGTKEKIKLQGSTSPNQRIRIAGRGIPTSPNAVDRSDLYFIVQVTLPTQVTQEQKEVLEKLQILFEQQTPSSSS